MSLNQSRFRSLLALILLIACILATAVHADTDAVDFNSEQWVKTNAQVVDHMDRTCMIGSAYLEGIEFEDGIIEVDVAVTGARSYCGFVFRRQSDENYEEFYIRPHRAGLYPDALQYTPVINGISSWQLYNGEGYTSAGVIPEDEWVHLTLEVKGTQARVFLGDSPLPALTIDHLQHGKSRGTIGLYGQRNRTTYFSNFKYTSTSALDFPPAPPIETPPGTITDWELSEPFSLSSMAYDEHPGNKALTEMTWQPAVTDASGQVNVARYMGRTGREPDGVYAKTTIRSKNEGVKKYKIGYSDLVSVFLNGTILFSANSAYQSRDPSFLGIVGLNDEIYLPLKKGDNELLFMVAESFGGWAFTCVEGDAVFEHKQVKKKWETDRAFLIPEAVAFDPANNVFYISNYDAYGKSHPEEGQFISKVSVKGEIEELKWTEGLLRPTGMAVYEDRLYVVDRRSLAEINTTTGEMGERFGIPGAGFPNDIAIDENGNIYISDTRRSVIYRKPMGGEIEEWLKSGEIRSPNGLHVNDGMLIIGSSGDNCLKSVDLGDKTVRTIVKLCPGNIDGVQTDKDGNYIVSQWEGRVYRITPTGQVEKLLDTTTQEYNCADLAFMKEKGLLVIPTFFENRVMAYELK